MKTLHVDSHFIVWKQNRSEVSFVHADVLNLIKIGASLALACGIYRTYSISTQ